MARELHFYPQRVKKMHKTYLIAIAASGLLGAQDMERHASIGHGPGGGIGCTVSVMVDGAAEVEIHGERAMLRNLSGAPAHFGEFECSGPMPPDAPGFRFTAESGRGRQELIRPPREGGPAIVRIEDPEPGEGEYRFRLTWGDGGEGRETGAMRDRDREREGDGSYVAEREHFFQGEAWRRNLFQRVREDVEHVSHSTFPFTGDRVRLDRTIAELNQLQSKLSEGWYDEHALDEVIGALRGVVDENRMSGRDRDAIADDLNRLRDFREHHDEYGARYPRP
jgi:hypothetical protein